MSWVSGYQYKKVLDRVVYCHLNLFGLYSEKIMSTAQDLEGVQIGDKNINNLNMQMTLHSLLIPMKNCKRF